MHKKNILFIKYILVGILIGGGGILPGVSGGVLAIVFGVYGRIMEIIANPKKNFIKSLDLIIPLALGGAIGFIVLSKFLIIAMEYNSNITISLFIGLIIGTLPQLIKEARSTKKDNINYIIMIVVSLVIIFGLGYVIHFLNIQLPLNAPTYVVCGILWGIGSIVPGFATSSILISLGLYQQILEKFTSFDLLAYVFSLSSAGITIILLAKLFVYLLSKYHSYVMHGVLAITFSTTILIVPTNFNSITELILSLVSAFVGMVIAYLMVKLDNLTTKESNK